jgi:hypothetical protein
MTGHIQGDRFEVSVTDGGVVRLDLAADGAEITTRDAEAAIDAVASLTAGVRSPLLVDVRSVGPMKRSARRVFADSNVASRVALLVGSPVSRMLASFGLGLDRPRHGIPLKVFEDEASARQWLLDQGDDA